MQHVWSFVFEGLCFENCRHLLGHEEEDIQLVVAQITYGVDIFATGEREHQVAGVQPLGYPLPRLFLAVDGVGEDGQPGIVVLEQPLHGVGVAPYGITEGSQLGIATIHQPAEEILPPCNVLHESQQDLYVVLLETHGKLAADDGAQLGFESLLELAHDVLYLLIVECLVGILQDKADCV